MCIKSECRLLHKDLLSVSGSRETGGKVHWPSYEVTLYRDLSELNIDHIRLNFHENPYTGSPERERKYLSSREMPVIIDRSSRNLHRGENSYLA